MKTKEQILARIDALYSMRMERPRSIEPTYWAIVSRAIDTEIETLKWVLEK